MATIRDIAAEAGVSVGTASAVFNRRQNISDRSRELVLEAARKLDYQPRPRPNLRRPNVALLLPGKRGDAAGIATYEAHLIMAITRELGRPGFLFEIIPAAEAEVLSKDLFQGAIALFGGDDPHKTIESLKRRIPVISINSPEVRGHTVSSDGETAVFKAVELLARYGHRRIGLFSRPFAKLGAARQRLRGYLKGVEEFGLERDEALVTECMLSTYPWVDVVAPLLRANPTAIIILGEDTAPPVLHALFVLGKRVPHDISVISYENPALSPVLTPPHTTIAQDMQRIAEEAVRGMDELIRGKTAGPISVTIPCHIIERQSVKDLGTQKTLNEWAEQKQ